MSAHQSILQSWHLHNRTTVSFSCCNSKRISSCLKMSNFQAARFPSFATSLPIVLALTFQHHFAAQSSTPCITCRTLVYVRLSPSSQGDLWPQMNIDVRRWTRACFKCQLIKVQRNTVSPLGTFTPPDSPISHVHLDIVGPLPPSQNSRYMLTSVDRFTQWPEELPLTDITAESVARRLIIVWISCYGVPKTITRDQHCQFDSTLFRTLSQVQAQLREFSALVDEARRCSAKNAECPERAWFLALR
ncbi:hypothetical protein MRX96_001703 [Rhipicephalus microplus]